MLVSCWSTKGGAGTTVVAAALALLLAREAPGGAVLADLDGDLPFALGLSDADRPGLAAWLSAAPDVPADALVRLEEPVAPGLVLLRRGGGPAPARHADLLAGLLAADPRPVVADCGLLDGADTAADGWRGGAGAVLAAGATRSLLVLRPCFLAVRRAAHAPVRPSGIVLMAEEGRALTAADVEDAVGAPVLARVRVTEQIARTVDAGLLASRLPRSLARDLRDAA